MEVKINLRQSGDIEIYRVKHKCVWTQASLSILRRGFAVSLTWNTHNIRLHKAHFMRRSRYEISQDRVKTVRVQPRNYVAWNARVDSLLFRHN